jgi:A/G-specific adenine glycosylase
MRKLEDAKHIFTHAEWHMRSFGAEVKGFMPEGEHAWVSACDLKDFTIPSAFKAYRKYLP